MPSSTPAPDRLLRHPWRRLRRRVLLHRRGLAVLLLAAGVVCGLGALRAPAETTTSVWVAAHDLDGASPIGPSDLRRERLPRDAVPAGTVAYAAIVDRRPTGPVRAGEPLTDRRLVGPGLLETYPGRAAVPVRLTDPGTSALVHLGDRVDLVRTDPQGDGPASLLAARAVVLAVVEDPDEDAATPAASGSGGIVLVAVDESAAPEVAAAGAAGFLTVTFSR